MRISFAQGHQSGIIFIITHINFSLKKQLEVISIEIFDFESVWVQ